MVILLATGLNSCQKEALPSSTALGATTSDPTVGLPPGYFWWSTLTPIPYVAYTKKDPVTDAIYALGFAINDTGYVLGGMLETEEGETDHVPDLWKYDQTTSKWSKKAPFPGEPNSLVFASQFVIGQNVFVITNNLVWQYNQPTNKWTQKANFPGASRFAATAMTINGKGYLGLGTDEIELGFLKDWWQYDPTTDHWIQMRDYGGEAREGAGGFSLNGKGYVVLGLMGTVFISTVWQYDPVANTWTQKRNFPGSARRAEVTGSAIIGGAATGILAGGDNNDVMMSDFWEYNPVTDVWSEGSPIPGGARDCSASFVLDHSFVIANQTVVSYNWTK